MINADAEVARIMTMSDDEIMREVTADDAAWARGFKLGMASGKAAASAGDVEEMARAIFEADPDVGMSWTAFLALAAREPDFLQNVEHTRRAARAAALARPRAAVGNLEQSTGRLPGDHGTHEQAVHFALEVHDDQLQTYEFLQAWSEGNLEEWPEFHEWLAKQEGK